MLAALPSQGPKMVSPSVGASPSPKWKILFEAAVIELDPILLPERIDEARAAVNTRFKELQSAPPCEETFKLLDALKLLDDLERMQRGNVA